MLHSMTAFAAKTGASEMTSWQIEMRGVNAKGLDIRLRLPESLNALEQKFRATLQKKFARGNISVSLKLERVQGGGQVTIDEAVVEAYVGAAIRIGEIAEAKGLSMPQSRASDFLALRGVVTTSDDLAKDAPQDVVLADFNEAMDAFAEMRASEGAALANVLSAQVDEIAQLTDRAQSLAEERRVAQAGKLHENLEKILDGVTTADPDRVAQELALLAVKSDVTEEIDRLKAHIDAVRELLKTKGPVGRKLDFLMQEFNREANTLCAKAGAPDLTRVGLEMKTVIDQMREQVQNVE